MEILKTIVLAGVIAFQAITVSAQVESSVTKAFRESYKMELNKDYDRAIAALTPVYADSYEMNLRMGWLYYNNKNYTQAAAYYEKAVMQKPEAVEAKLGLIMPLSFLESWDKVLKQYEDILKADPMNVTANYWAGTIYYNRKKYDVAAKYFEKVVKQYPFGFDGNHMLAWTYLNLGKMQDAKTLFNRALMISPDNASAVDGLGRIK